MSTLRKAAQQALEVLESVEPWEVVDHAPFAAAISALRAALNQERYVVTGNEFHGAPPEHYANWGDAIAAMIDRGVIQGLRISALAEDRSADTGKTSDHIADANKMVATINEMAREAGIFTGGHPMNPWSVYPSDLERFAALVIAAEREACAQVAAIALLGADKSLSDRVVNAIRARGEQ